MIFIMFILIKLFSESLCSVDKGPCHPGRDHSPIRTEMFHHVIKVMSQNDFVLIYSGL